jgi:heterodisulfide reductase subunit C
MPGANQAQVMPNNTLLEEIETETGIKVSACYQCKKCTNGCPVTFAMDIYPDRVIRLIQLGQEERVLNCNTIWICSACETCTTRCPNEVDIAGAMDYMKERAIKAKITIPQPKTYAFHRAFLADIKRRGRVFEGGLMLSYMLRSGEFKRKLFKFDVGADIWLGWNMFKRGRMKLLPKGIKGKKEIKKLLK